MRRHSTILGTFTLALLAVGCGGSAQHEGPRSAAGGVQPSEAPASPPGQSQPTVRSGGEFGGAADQPASAPGDDSSSREEDFDGTPKAPRRSSEALAESEPARPGLATQWGETRESKITTSPFFREDGTSPASVSKLFYNDHAGARAMAQRSGFVGLESAEFSVGGGALTVSLRDESGSPLTAFTSNGQNFAVGEAGQRYSIHVTNHTGVRLEAVATVDGLDVIDGRDGSFSKRGYILNPFSALEIDGFRQSMDTVAAFRFGSVSSSYAASKGKARNVGVIGVAFFQERGSEWPWNGGEVHRRETADPFPARFAEPPR